MALISSNVGGVLKMDWNDNKYCLRNGLNKNNTYCVIFSAHQERQKEALIKNKKVNILYKAPKAVNKVYGHGIEPRNTLVIFELK